MRGYTALFFRLLKLWNDTFKSFLDERDFDRLKSPNILTFLLELCLFLGLLLSELLLFTLYTLLSFYLDSDLLL